MKRPTYDGMADLGNLRILPDEPGVYFFRDAAGDILYIGKATSLRTRVRSYFSSDILETRGPKVAKMLGCARSVAWRVSESVLEALLLESRLIKAHQPPYNTDAKDDKSYNHVAITDEEYPRVLLVRGRDLAEGAFVSPTRSLYGPFPHGVQLREAMRIIRKLFPYRDKCEPWSKAQGVRSTERGKVNPKPCFHRQIGLCPGVCTGEISAREYGKTVRYIERFFEGRKSEIVRRLTREMNAAAKRYAFERAKELRDTIFALGHIQDIALLKPETGNEERARPDVRIEAYDVAHLGGSSSVGVMAVCSGVEPERDEYRKFLLRGKHIGNDLSALEEILRRRLGHHEWPKPDIVAVDGSFLQLGVAERLVADAGWEDVRLVGVVKNRKHQPERLIGDRLAIAEHRRAILLGNAEAHRFAIGYHRKRRGKDFLGGA